MSALTANEIKTQLIALLTPVIGTALTKKVKLLDYLPLAFVVPEHEDISALRSSLDTTTLASGKTDARVNCLMIVENGLGQRPPQQDATRGITEPRGRNLITRRLNLFYVYQYGQASEATFSTNIETIRVRLNDNPKLGFATVTAAGLVGKGADIQNHGALQVSSILPASFAGVICHVAEMSLDVNVYEALET